MSTEESREHFRGWWIPIEIVRLMRSGEIKPSELILLATIDSLVSETKGCFAQNETLAEMTGLSVRTVIDMIQNLESKGLVIRVGFDGKARYLETKWSRIVFDKINYPWLKDRVRSAEIASQECRNCSPQVQKLQGDQRDNKRGQQERDVSPSINGHSNGHSGFELPGEEPKEKSYWRKSAELLCQHLLEKRQLMREPHLDKWAESFRLFIVNGLIEKDRFDNALKWYVKHIGEEFIPRARSADTFCEKFIQIEDQMNMKIEKEPEEYKEPVSRQCSQEEALEMIRRADED